MKTLHQLLNLSFPSIPFQFHTWCLRIETDHHSFAIVSQFHIALIHHTHTCIHNLKLCILQTTIQSINLMSEGLCSIHQSSLTSILPSTSVFRTKGMRVFVISSDKSSPDFFAVSIFCRANRRWR